MSSNYQQWRTQLFALLGGRDLAATQLLGFEPLADLKNVICNTPKRYIQFLCKLKKLSDGLSEELPTEIRWIATTVSDRCDSEVLVLDMMLGVIPDSAIEAWADSTCEGRSFLSSENFPKPADETLAEFLKIARDGSMGLVKHLEQAILQLPEGLPCEFDATLEEFAFAITKDPYEAKLLADSWTRNGDAKALGEPTGTRKTGKRGRPSQTYRVDKMLDHFRSYLGADRDAVARDLKKMLKSLGN